MCEFHGKHTPEVISSFLSPRASPAAEARVPMLALESFATLLLASLLAPEVSSLTLSLAALTVFLIDCQWLLITAGDSEGGVRCRG